MSSILDYDCNGKPLKLGDLVMIVTTPPPHVAEGTPLHKGAVVSILPQPDWTVTQGVVYIWVDEARMQAVYADGLELMKLTPDEKEKVSNEQLTKEIS